MIHKTAAISKGAKIGKNVMIWSFSQVRERAEVGDNCIIGRNVYIDHDVKIGSNVKIQNNALVYFQTIIENDVFIGPGACLINDKYPRAANRQGILKTANDWAPGKIVVKRGASIGSGAIILPNVTIGAYSLIGAASVVTGSIQDYSKIFGNPARLAGYVCKIGHKAKITKKSKESVKLFCPICKETYLASNE